MAVIRQIESRPGLDTAAGSRPSTRLDDSVGQGLRQLGGSISQAGNVLAEIDMRRERMKMEMSEFRTDQSLRRFNDDFALDFAQTQQNIDPSGEGFTEAVSQRFNKQAETFLQTVPDNLKPKFAELVKTQRETYLNKAAAAEVDQRNTWYRKGISDSQQQLQTQVFNDPSLYDAALQDGNRAIDLSGLPSTEKKALREAWEEALSVTVGEREVRDAEADPTTAATAADRLGVRGATQGDSVAAVVDRIIGVESGGNATAKNPKSSASGLGQFTDGTWLATVRQHRPDLAGMSDSAVLKLKTDPHLGREMTTRLTEDNARGLASAGAPITPGNLYLAHFAGIGGARAVLNASDAQSLDNVLGKAAVKANPFLAGKNVGWLKAWADRKMGGKSGAGQTVSAPMDPRYASLSLSKRLEIYDRTIAAAERGQTAINAQVKAQYDQHKGAMELGIETGDVGSELTILQDTILNDAHKADLVASFRSKNKDRLATADALAAFKAGALQVDPYDSEGRKTVDNMFGEIAKTVPADQVQQTTEAIVRQTGVVPKAALNAIRGGLTSQNVSEVQAAAQSAQRLSVVDPAALGRRDGGKDVQDAADDFSHYVNNLNMSPEQAARRLMEARDPQKQRDRKALEPLAKEFIKARHDDDVASFFDDSFGGWRSNPQLGFSPAQEAGIKAEYVAIAEDEFYRANGDAELATNRAKETLKRLYGVTDLTGSPVVMKHPPERYWPALRHSGGNSTQNLNYATQQLETDLRQFYPDADMGSVQLVTTPATDAMVKRGEMPGYSVLYRDKDGVLQTIPGQLWRPDLSKEDFRIEFQMGIDEREQRQTLENARRMQGAAQEDMTRQELIEQDRINTGNFMRGGQPVPPVRATPPSQQEQLQDQRQQLMQDSRQAPNDAMSFGVP